ncbi:hypothetical protein PPERSA_05151 [Pseudocohnilembus persalinus]|uniref:Uncharacterized protein n=1 Tax=Pseudocohnilembus persalinus TaxID=266149 RepID=A0A0V0R9B8_PSEPJ|nr:hypothetical protein PPERSA_05151 [Pseudocohnilembus persalinus]|eukprot:KRX11042.1 hypothetical protein PPERSA_05151 [Pseudocohnilembus persalinus]
MLEIMQATDIFTDQKASLLSNIMDVMMGPQNDKKQKRIYKTESGTQTDYGDSIMNLENKLNFVDQQWKERVQREMAPTAASIEERMERFKKEYETRMKADMQAEITRIRNFEISNIRLEENEKAANEMQEYREELEKKYQEKLQRLREREKETLDRCAQKMKDIESYNHDHRQKLIKDFEMLKLREEAVEQQRQVNEEQLEAQKLKYENMIKEYKFKINELETQRRQNEQYADDQKSMVKLEVNRQVQSEHLDFMEKKKQLDQEIYRIDSIKESLEQQRKQNLNLTEQNKQYTEKIEEMTKKIREYELDIKQLRDTLSNVTDSYKREQGQGKNQNEALRLKDEEIKLLKKALEDKDEILAQQKQNQIEQMKKMNSEISHYQNQIEKFENQQRQLKQQLAENEEMIMKGVGQPISYIAQKHPQNESMTISKLNQSYVGRKTGIEMELEKNKEARRKALEELMAEDEQTDKRGYNAKFKNVWDLSDSQIQFSQMPSMAKKEIEKRDMIKDIHMQASQQIQKSQQQQHHQQYQQNPLEKGILEKVDVAQSMSYDQSIPGGNIIEQAFRQQEIGRQNRENQQQQQYYQQYKSNQQKKKSSDYEYQFDDEKDKKENFLQKKEEDSYQTKQQQQNKQSKPSRGKKIFEDIEQYGNRDDNLKVIEEKSGDKYLNTPNIQSKHHVTSQSKKEQSQEINKFKSDEGEDQKPTFPALSKPKTNLASLPGIGPKQTQAEKVQSKEKKDPYGFDIQEKKDPYGFDIQEKNKQDLYGFDIQEKEKKSQVSEAKSSQKKQSKQSQEISEEYGDEIFEEIVEDLDDF